MQVRLLGPVGLWDDGRVSDVPGVRRRAVLATLALRPGELVSVDKIVEAVWDEDPPATVRNTIQSHIGYLRRSFGSAGAVVHRPPGYVLALAGPATDVVEVEALVARARDTEDAEDRVVLWRQALDHWRGPSLAGAGDSAYLARHAEVLEDLRLSTLERLYADRLRLGDHASAASELERLLPDHLDRESLARLAMTALYRAGRRDDALAAYRRLEIELRRRLGVGASESTRVLHRRIVDQDRALRRPGGAPRGLVLPVEPVAEAIADRPDDARAGRPRGGRLIGRERELGQLLDLLETSVLASVLGMGGVGKTRLAGEVVVAMRARGRDAVVLDLVDAPAGALVERIGAALGIPPPEGDGALPAIAAALASRPRLLVLDGCEAMIEEAADVVTALTALGVRGMLATSREPLHVAGEDCLLLGSLPVPALRDADLAASPSVRMLVERARSADPAFTLGADNADAVAEICRRVDGLPLALEIIGPRLRSLTATELAATLSGRLLTWSHLRREVSDRHRSIGALMAWSYSLLSAAEQAALDRLSLLRGGAWLAEAGALCADDPASGEDLLLGLIDRSLVVRTEVGGRSRVSLHALVQAYARTHLVESGLEDDAAARHATWVTGLVHAAVGRLHGPDEPESLARLAADEENIRVALTWQRDHDAAAVAALTWDLWWVWFRLGRSAEGLAWARSALESSEVTGGARARVAAVAGYLAWVVDEYDDALALGRDALALGAGDQEVIGVAWGVLARATGDAGEFAQAAAYARAGIEAYEVAGDSWGMAWSRRCLATALLYDDAEGSLTASAEACTTSRTELEALGDAWGVAGALDIESRVAAARGDHPGAVELAARSLAAHRACGDTSGERYVLQHLAESCWQLGRDAEAAAYAEESLDLARDHGYRVGELQAVQLLRDLAERRGQDAAAWRRSADLLVAELGDAAVVSQTLAATRREEESTG